MSAFFNIHVFCEASSEEMAARVASKFSDLVSPLGKTSIRGIRQYWKIPEYFEFCVEISCDNLIEHNASKVLDRLGGQWDEVGGGLISSPTTKTPLVDSTVRWAHVEYIEAA